MWKLSWFFNYKRNLNLCCDVCKIKGHYRENNFKIIGTHLILSTKKGISTPVYGTSHRYGSTHGIVCNLVSEHNLSQHTGAYDF